MAIIGGLRGFLEEKLEGLKELYIYYRKTFIF